MSLNKPIHLPSHTIKMSLFSIAKEIKQSVHKIAPDEKHIDFMQQAAQQGSADPVKKT